jgi:hypothetical protein
MNWIYCFLVHCIICQGLYAEQVAQKKLAIEIAVDAALGTVAKNKELQELLIKNEIKVQQHSISLTSPSNIGTIIGFSSLLGVWEACRESEFSLSSVIGCTFLFSACLYLEWFLYVTIIGEPALNKFAVQMKDSTPSTNPHLWTWVIVPRIACYCGKENIMIEDPGHDYRDMKIGITDGTSIRNFDNAEDLRAIFSSPPSNKPVSGRNRHWVFPSNSK